MHGCLITEANTLREALIGRTQIMLSKPMERNKTFFIFLKRCIKYMFIFMIFVSMLVPLVYKSYALAKRLTIDKSSIKL